MMEESQDKQLQVKDLAKAIMPTYEIALYGSLGGFSKETIAVLNSIEGSHQPDADPPLQWSDFGLVMLVLPLNMLLGAISAVVGIFLLTDTFKAPEHRQKMLAMAVVFGLSFPAIFHTVTDNLQLAARNNELIGENQEALDTLEDAHRDVQTVKSTLDNGGAFDKADTQVQLKNVQDSLSDAASDIRDDPSDQASPGRSSEDSP